MINKLRTYFMDARARQRIGIALAKGGAALQLRRVDPTRPETWEFSGFSQNGEDGILEVLRGRIKNPNRYFIEIGSSDGTENNSAWMVVVEKYDGLMIEGDIRPAELSRRTVAGYSLGAEVINMFVTQNNVKELLSLSRHADPDVFSLDIDGNDYYIARAILDGGFRPKIFVVEYNSVYGPERSLTIEYRDDFVMSTAHPSQLYYGVSIAGWKKFFAVRGYRFVTVDRNGVNGFFVDPACFDAAFLDRVRGLAFAENRYQYGKFRKPSEQQFALIADQKFFAIP